MNFRTFSDLNAIIFNNLDRIPEDVDLIVGIPRSGMLVANIISLYMNLPMVDFNSFIEGRIYSCGSTRKKNWISNVEEARRILLVDDSTNTGKAIKEAEFLLKDSKFHDKIVTLIPYVTSKSKSYPDIYFEECEMPRVFEWNYLHHLHLEKMCFDLDGVLCRDPYDIENDDGERYKYFIQNVPAKIVPSFEIGYIITARLEKYRRETEEWLKKNNIRYGQLIMMDCASKEERIRSGAHGWFKGTNYKKLRNAILFIESNEQQAVEIANISKKAVFCTENHMFYEAKGMYRALNRVKTEQKSVIRKIYDFIVPYIPKSIDKMMKKMIRVVRKKGDKE